MTKENIMHKRGKSLLYTIIAFVLLTAMLVALADYLYLDAEERAMETLHVQTKQIKDDLTLQLISDRENLSTMASFAAKLHTDGEDYSLLFESFKPIGLISNVGILLPDNTFITKKGTIDLDGEISFAEEVAKGAYITGRVSDVTNVDYERVRSAVPIKANDEVIGVLYGIIKLESIEERYNALAKELDAQLFVYSADTGHLIVDTVHDELGNISFLKDRLYNKNYSYEEFISSDKGFSSFRSAYKDENVLMHYSEIEELGWKIAMVRYDSQVYAETHALMSVLLIVLGVMVIIMTVFGAGLISSERRKNNIVDCASNVRRILIEASGSSVGANDNITEALKEACVFTKARSAIFFDTNDEDYRYIVPEMRHLLLEGEKRMTFKAELLRHVTAITAQEDSAFKVMSLRADSRLAEVNPAMYAVMKESSITEVVFSATVSHANHITLLALVNPKRRSDASYLVEKVSACFAIALNNRNILNRTRLAATTDSLTGVLNRVAYNSDLHIVNEERPFDFSCIYVDVNELHYLNNKYGHAAGDEMLLFIAHSLKDAFFGQRVYRMGGDEFLVFTQGIDQDSIKSNIELFLEQLEPRGYHVAIGMSFRSQNTNTEEMVREAEVRMYENKAKYYQSKEHNATATAEREYIQAKTGIPEIDTILSLLKESYHGIYRISLDTDVARRVLMPAYLNFNETEEHFSTLFAKYVSDFADAEYNRALLNFANYDALRQELAEGRIPRITYKKHSGETVTLTVHPLGEAGALNHETLWIFAKR